jgi:hypothetical protein
MLDRNWIMQFKPSEIGLRRAVAGNPVGGGGARREEGW